MAAHSLLSYLPDPKWLLLINSAHNLALIIIVKSKWKRNDGATQCLGSPQQHTVMPITDHIRFSVLRCQMMPYSTTTHWPQLLYYTISSIRKELNKLSHIKRNNLRWPYTLQHIKQSLTMRKEGRTERFRSHIEMQTSSAATVCARIRSKFIGHLLAIK